MKFRGYAFYSMEVQPSQPARHNSMLEINHGEHRYVVSYTLKSRAECGDNGDGGGSCIFSGGIHTVEHHPDILNPPHAEISQQRAKGLLQPQSPGVGCPPPDFSGHMVSSHMGASEYSVSSPDSLGPMPPHRSQPATESAMPVTVPFSTPGVNKSSLIASSPSCTLNGGLRKEHIISDSIPGPESCV